MYDGWAVQAGKPLAVNRNAILKHHLVVNIIWFWSLGFGRTSFFVFLFLPKLFYTYHKADFNLLYKRLFGSDFGGHFILFREIWQMVSIKLLLNWDSQA